MRSSSRSPRGSVRRRSRLWTCDTLERFRSAEIPDSFRAISPDRPTERRTLPREPRISLRKGVFMRLVRSMGVFLLCMAMVLSLACSTGSRPAVSAAPSASAMAVPAAAAAHGLDPGDMDPSAPPCGDFYRYADGGG